MRRQRVHCVSPFAFTFAPKFLCTAGSVAQAMTFSDGQYFPPGFSTLKTLGFNLLSIKLHSAQLNFLGAALVAEIITLMLNTSQRQTAAAALDLPLKMNMGGGGVGLVAFFT